MIRYSCPECDTHLKSADEKAGHKIDCPKCGHRIQVPFPDEANAESEQIQSKPVSHASAKTAPGKATSGKAAPGPKRPAGKQAGGKRPAEKKSQTALYVGIGVGALLLIAGGVLAAVMLSSKSKPEPIAKGPPSPTRPNPQGGMPGGPGGMRNSMFQGGFQNPSKVAKTATPATNPEPTTPTPPVTKPALENPVPSFGGDIGIKVANRLLKSTVFIVVDTGGGFVYEGTGTLVDKEHKLILTAAHVVDAPGKATIYVAFPIKKNGELVKEKKLYVQKILDDQGGYPAKVFKRVDSKDLAIIQLLGALPGDVESLPVATASVATGQRVHALGNPGRLDSCWNYVSGTVRNVLKTNWKAGAADGSHIQDYDAWVVYTQTPTNEGDSGGPLVNDYCQLVGVTHGASAKGQLLNLFIDVREVRALINACRRDLGEQPLPETAPAGIVVDTASLGKLAKDLQSKDARVRLAAVSKLNELGPEAKDTAPDLVKMLKDPEEQVRKLAAQALNQMGPPGRGDMPVLMEALKDQRLVEVRAYAASALGKLGRAAKEAVGPLCQALQDPEAQVRLNAATALEKIGAETKEAMLALTEALKDDQVDVRVHACKALGRMGPACKPALPKLIDALKDEHPEMRVAACTALESLGADAKDAVPALKGLLRQSDPDTHQAAIKVLGAIGPEAKDVVKLLVLDLGDKKQGLRLAASDALVKIGAASVPVLSKALTNPNGDIRLAAVQTLGALGAKAKTAVKQLNILKRRERDEEIRDAIDKAVDRIKADQ